MTSTQAPFDTQPDTEPHGVVTAPDTAAPVTGSAEKLAPG